MTKTPLKTALGALIALGALAATLPAQAGKTIDTIKVVETIKEGVTVFDIASLKKAGASIQSGGAGELAFTRAMASTASHLGHHDDHAHGGGCLCGAMSQLAAIIAGAEEK